MVSFCTIYSIRLHADMYYQFHCDLKCNAGNISSEREAMFSLRSFSCVTFLYVLRLSAEENSVFGFLYDFVSLSLIFICIECVLTTEMVAVDSCCPVQRQRS